MPRVLVSRFREAAVSAIQVSPAFGSRLLGLNSGRSANYAAGLAIAGGQPQQLDERPVCCIGGHGTVPYEQKTQQSPAVGRKTDPQPRQS